MSDNLYAVRRFKERLKEENGPAFELRPGDMLVNTETNVACVVVKITSRAETLKEIVELFSSDLGGKGSMTFDTVKSQCKKGLFKVVKGSAWSTEQGGPCPQQT